MMKAILVILLVLPYAIIYPQDQDFERSIMTGVYAKGGWNMPVRLTTKYITEETSPWHGYQSWSAGVNVSGMLSENYRIEIAGCYSRHKIGFELSPPIYAEEKIYTETFDIFSIPVTLKRYVQNSFYISAGTIVDFALHDKPVRLDSQTGFGLTLGAGKEIRIKDFIIDVAPGLELHSVVPFTEADNQQRLFVAGLKIGFSYNFPSATDQKDQENEKSSAKASPGSY
jgi:hypothetical protein